MNVIGLDIGGANLKAADGDGNTKVVPFPIWKQLDQLTAALTGLLSGFATPDVFAVTMTAELADCFETKAEGVNAILRAVETVAGSVPVFVWQTGAEFVTPEVAREIPLLVAAANWHALATWAGRLVPNDAALLIDIGTTTTDIIPLENGVPIPRGMTDVERLQSHELVYTGVRRTPVLGIALSVPFREGYCPLASELFATTLDVYLILEDIAENSADCETANGRPATKQHACNRLARMFCCDRNELAFDDIHAAAKFLADVQQQRITSAIDRVLSGFTTSCKGILISGAGSFLAERIIKNHRRLKSVLVSSLNEILSENVSEAACAFALARLGAERLVGIG